VVEPLRSGASTAHSPPLLDSPAAFERIEDGGGREFRHRTGGALGELHLHGRDDEGWTWVGTYGRRYPRARLRI
jgi:hypothetical protein